MLVLPELWQVQGEQVPEHTRCINYHPVRSASYNYPGLELLDIFGCRFCYYSLVLNV